MESNEGRSGIYWRGQGGVGSEDKCESQGKSRQPARRASGGVLPWHGDADNEGVPLVIKVERDKREDARDPSDIMRSDGPGGCVPIRKFRRSRA